MTELLTDPEVLRKLEPNKELLKTIMQLKHMMKGEVLELARQVVRKVADELTKKLEQDMKKSFSGQLNRSVSSPVKSMRNLDMKKTIRRNLKNYDTESKQIVLKQVYFSSRMKKFNQWRVVICVDESGSMLDSVIHSAVMAGIFARLPMLDTKLVIFDTSVVDLSGYVSDPVETLMSVQLGGGTNIGGALAYCEQLIEMPHRTMVIKEVLLETLSTDKEITVNVGEETVHIKVPLGESTCSCPSRSICRHIVLGILVVKEAVSQETISQGISSQEIDSQETAKQIDNKGLNDKKYENSDEAKGMDERKEPRQSEDSMLDKVMQQITAYPTEKLCKSLGTRKLQEFIGYARAGIRPQITYSSVVTVQPLAKSMTVKLLFPLEYSTCTCHKKEFCSHKAEAVLWCKLEAGQVSPDKLEEEQAETSDYDMNQIKDAVLQMRAFLEELLDTGLSRTSQDALDHMERLATICHNAKLPNFESDWRRLQDSYKKYLNRVASLKIQDLMRRITTLYRQVELLGQAQNALAVAKLAGAFRADYTPALDLNLVGIASEHFVSRSGYEGDTIYFLEENTRKWYTYTQARPVFYDNSAAARQYMQESPWGVALPLEEFAFWHIHLEHAKCDSRGRLSSSKETKGQAVSDRRNQNVLTTNDLGNWYYKDFAKLFEEQFQDKIDALDKNDLSDADSTTWEKLVFLRPASCEKAVFLETEQKLCMNLYDETGKAVVVEVVYSKDEAEGIRYLEKITNDNLPCFFGKIYLRGGIIRMYPVAVFGKKELIEGAL